MDEGRFSVSAASLYERIGTAAAPRVIDVRTTRSYAGVAAARTKSTIGTPLWRETEEETRG